MRSWPADSKKRANSLVHSQPTYIALHYIHTSFAGEVQDERFFGACAPLSRLREHVRLTSPSSFMVALKEAEKAEAVLKSSQVQAPCLLHSP